MFCIRVPLYAKNLNVHNLEQNLTMMGELKTTLEP